MNAIFKSKSTRLLSAFLAVLMVVAMLPVTAFAWTAEEGTKCTSTYGDLYLGSDGNNYYSKAGNTLFYNDDGSFYVSYHNGGVARYKYLMIDSNGTSHHVYCIESGVSYNYSDTYNGSSGKNSKYFQNLPITAQYGIMMALMYGWHDGASSPISGTNIPDGGKIKIHLLQVVEQTLTPDNTETRIALDTDREKVYWIYFNPDSTAGGQYVSGELDFNVFKELIDQYDIENHPENAEQFAADLEEMSDQFLADINTPFFAEAENEYEGTTVYTGFTSENILQIYEAILSYETDRDAERDLNRHEAEFGADGTRVFRDTEERQVQPETGPFIDHYYVVEDLAAAPLSVTEYPDREEALEAYFALPTDTMKAFGVVNTKELPGSLDFIQCRDGKDTLIEDYAKTDDDSWRNPEIEGLIDQLKEKLAERDKPIAPPPQKQRSGKVTPHVLLPEINTEYRTNFRIERDDIGVGTPLERLFGYPPYIDMDSIRGFMKNLSYPLYFLDFECHRFPIPCGII